MIHNLGRRLTFNCNCVVVSLKLLSSLLLSRPFGGFYLIQFPGKLGLLVYAGFFDFILF